MKTNILIVGEHPSNHSGFGRLVNSLANIFKANENYDDVTVIGLNGRNLDSYAPKFLVINNRDYLEEQELLQEDANGFISISRFLLESEANGKVFNECLLIGDPWNQSHIFNLKSLFPTVRFTYYCPVEGETLPHKVTHHMPGNNAHNPNIELDKIIKEFDFVIPYSQTGRAALDRFYTNNITKHLFHSVEDPKNIQVEIIPELMDKVKDKFVISWIGRNCFRKGLDIAIQTIYNISKYYPSSNAILVLHTSNSDAFGYDIKGIIHDIFFDRQNEIEERIVILEDIIPNLFISANNNMISHDIKKGLSENQLEYVYSITDAFLNTSRSEGFGFPIAEAIARGIPTLCPDYATPGEILKTAKVQDNLLINCDNTFTYYANGNNCKMGAPNASHAAFLLFSLENNKKLSFDLSQKLLNFANSRLIINGKSDLEQMPELIKKFDAFELRNYKTIMLTSYHNKCGIKTYTDHFQRAGLEFTQYRNKDLTSLIYLFKFITGRILHIQYEPALWDIGQLALLCKAAGEKNKVVITVHTVNDKLKGFESVMDSISLFILHREVADLSKFCVIPTNKIKITTHPFITFHDNTLSLENKKYFREKMGIKEDEIVIGLNGFVLPYKQIPSQASQILNAIKTMGDKYKLLLVCSPHENDRINNGLSQLNSIKKFARNINMQDKLIIKYGFFDTITMTTMLNCMDYAVFYHNNANIGSQSGSIRELISARVIPIVRIGKTLNMHDDIVQAKCAIALNANDGNISAAQFASMSCNVINKLTNNELDDNIKEVALASIDKYVEENSFYKAAEALYSTYKNL